MKTRIFSQFLSSLKLTSSRTSYAACTLMIACSLGIPANAATIAVTYNFAGDAVGTPVISGSIETVDHLSIGSVFSGNPSLNAILNPFTLLSHDVVDFAGLTLNGASTITFADGSMLFGHQFVDFSKPNIPETLTFSGGTGKFNGATGSFSGDSVVFAAAILRYRGVEPSTLRRFLSQHLLR